ncbi:MmpS family transport accessory protein [Pseudonocardia sp. WMMC193]|uniref:MmpS family transport accessory protein n=1 Tax=Pseudonocardia sp. WMMC193 TaxID=2911965 RepID=UPI001F1BFBD0|nr:MmpS family transport accessory protein [Pseudonocardia sp. WMMC193]MCF7547149.1 MmpS family protein [Pseudonocardia sp. WMMC193]MCF7547243.1 MmpS family protein [Pseudonocardia sp. WMMC193]
MNQRLVNVAGWTVGAICVLVVLIWLVIPALTAPKMTSGGTPIAETSANSVTYEVTGPSTAVEVSTRERSDDLGVFDYPDVSLPWRKTVMLPAPTEDGTSLVQVNATRHWLEDEIRCRVIADGEVISEDTAGGSNYSVMCRVAVKQR